MLFCFSIYSKAECCGAVGLNHHPKGGTHAGGAKAPVRPWYIDQESMGDGSEVNPKVWTD